MTKQMNMAPDELPLAEAVNRTPNHYEGETMNTSVAHAPEKFDTTMKTTVNHGGTTATMHVSFSEWLGQHDVHLYVRDKVLEGIYLAPHEARDLAAALQALANHIDEDECTIITRRTEAGAPTFEDGI